jgi:hypothetical protein
VLIFDREYSSFDSLRLTPPRLERAGASL